MRTKILLPNLIRILILLTLVIPLALGGFSPAKAATTYTVVAWGDYKYNQIDIPSGLTDVTTVVGGRNHSLALKSDGTVVTWGSNYLGQLNIPTGLSGVTAIGAGSDHSLALKSDGTVVAWGRNDSGQATVPAGLSDVSAITGGEQHSIALKRDGTVVAWGDNTYGQTEVPADLNNVDKIAASFYYSLALKSDGTVVAWGGTNNVSIPAGLSGVTAIAAAPDHVLALKSDGTVVAWGRNRVGDTDVPTDLTGVIAIAAGLSHSLALKNDGTVVAWGDNFFNQTDIPAGLSGVTAIAAGWDHSLAVVPFVPNENKAPVVGAITASAAPVAVNTAVNASASFTDVNTSDTHTATWDWGDGTSSAGTVSETVGSGTASGSHTYTVPGVYQLTLMVTDSAQAEGSATYQYVVVYDPNAGFVTGGGWIDSPAGAYTTDPTLVGQATFGFVSKYQKAASVPTGNTAFQFDLAGLSFSSTAYEWLVVNQGGTNAQFKGSGLINGAGASNGQAYKFMLWAGDGSPDTFRIRIWWEDAAGQYDVYDNGVEQAIGAGNIVVHTRK